MKTKLFIFVIILGLSASAAFAQVAEKGKTSLGILGGINFQNLTGKDFNGDKLENDLLIGYHAGINIQIPLVPEFYFQPGLIFSTKGAKNSVGSSTVTFGISYVELPLNLVYKGALGNGYIMLGFGPYVGYGIMGKVKFEGGGMDSSTDIEFTNVVEIDDPLTTPYLKALDAGGNIFAGYETGGGLFFQVNSQLGFLKINPEDKRFPGEKTAIKNTGFGFSLGYRF